MSDILIKGMEMPKNCSECCMYEADIYYCTVAERDIDIPGSSEGRCTFCPLVPVPPHGRCIDADALIEKVIAKYLEHERKGELVFAAVEIKQDIIDLISNAHTIIPASGGNE